MKIAPKPIPELSDKDKARFWRNVEKRIDGIWVWRGWRQTQGYGMICIMSNSYLAHRVSWALNERENGRSGEIPNGLHVLHRNDVTDDVCDVNPANLWLGTAADNLKDMFRKGRGNRARGDESASRLHPESRPKGESVWCAKLTESQIVTIRELGAMGFSQRKIGAQFGISHQHIGKILNHRKWACVP